MNIATIITALGASVVLIAVGQESVPLGSDLKALSSMSGTALMFLVVVLFCTKVLPKILDTNAEGHKAHAKSNEKLADAIDTLSDTMRETTNHCATVNAQRRDG